MAICDHLYRFKLIDIVAYGENSDGGIFEVSNIGKNMKNGQLNLKIMPNFLIVILACQDSLWEMLPFHIQQE